MLPKNGGIQGEAQSIHLLIDKYIAFPHPVTESYDFGGVALGDTSQGLQDYLWACRTDGQTIFIENKGRKDTRDGATPRQVLVTGADITEVSFTIDQNSRPVVAYVEGGQSKLRWFDPQSGGYTTTDLPGVRSPRVSLDDKRRERTGQSDIILSFIKGTTLYATTQRERYEDRIIVADDIGEDWFLWRAGLNVDATFRWMVYTKECYDAWLAGVHEPITN